MAAIVLSQIHAGAMPLSKTHPEILKTELLLLLLLVVLLFLMFPFNKTLFRTTVVWWSQMKYNRC